MAGAPLPRGGRDHQGVLDRAEAHLSGPFLSPEGRADAPEAGAKAAPADLDGGRASRRDTQDGAARRWLDGLGRFDQGGLGPQHPAAEGSAGPEWARPADLPDLEAGVHAG